MPATVLTADTSLTHSLVFSSPFHLFPQSHNTQHYNILFYSIILLFHPFVKCCEWYLSCVFFVTKISFFSHYRMAACIITVSQDGTADFLTVQEAIDAVPLGNIRRTVIRVSPGIYRQPVYIPKTKNFITLAALSPEDTVLTWNNTVAGINHHQVRTCSSLQLLPQMGLWACVKIVHFYDIIVVWVIGCLLKLFICFDHFFLWIED